LVEELWPDFYSFLISFWFVGTLWMAHHRVFHYIRGYDRTLLVLNLFFLMWIVLLPFSATLLSRFEDHQVAVIIYAAHVAVAELALAWVWRYASRAPQLIDTSRMDSRQRRYNELLVFAMPLIFAFSIGVSFISPQAAELSWLLVFLVRPVLLRITHYSSSYDAS
jgi:TMEM175 potassium channel family protein